MSTALAAASIDGPGSVVVDEADVGGGLQRAGDDVVRKRTRRSRSATMRRVGLGGNRGVRVGLNIQPVRQQGEDSISTRCPLVAESPRPMKIARSPTMLGSR